LKLLYVTQYYPPETGAGATRAEAMVRYLSALGWEIDVVTELPNYPEGKIHSNYHSSFFKREQTGSITVNRIWVWANRRETFLQQIAFFTSFMVSSFLYLILNPRKYNVIYVSSPPIFGAISSCIISKIFRSPFVLEVRDLWPDSATGIGAFSQNSHWYQFGKRIEKWLYKKADLIIPVTKKSEQYILNQYPDTKTFVIPNGVDIRQFRPIENAYDLLEESLNNNKFRVGFVGSLGVIHDFRTTLRAAKICERDPDIEFVIIGDGRNRSLLLKLMKDYQSKNIRWLGLKNHSKIPAYISTFDIGINPVNDTDIFKTIVTVKFYEYLACNVPVISLARGLMKEFGEQSESAITLEPGNGQKLAETILFLKSNPDQLEQLRTQARDWVIKNYDREKWAGILSSLLKERFIDS